MIAWRQAQELFVEKLAVIYGEKEARNLFYWVLEEAFGISRINYAMNKHISLLDKEYKELQKILQNLEKEQPIQYIFNTAYCRERAFYVDENVLIPRSETEMLIDIIVNKYKEKEVRLLDIGTGSACIAINLQKELKNAEVLAVDISKKALVIAQKNAENLQAVVNFKEIDILNSQLWDFVADNSLNIIVSNPPYVRNSEKVKMQRNVLDYEPTEALFVKDEEPLIFYDAIADFSLLKLQKGGALFFEINEYLADDLQALLEQKGYLQIQIIKDINDKNRFISAIK